MVTTLSALSDVYLLLLQQPPAMRINMQPTLSNLRDNIATIGGFDPEDVQNAHELVAACITERT